MARYMVKDPTTLRQWQAPPNEAAFFAFSIDQTEPVRKKKQSNKMPISLPKALPMKQLKKHSARS